MSSALRDLQGLAGDRGDPNPSAATAGAFVKKNERRARYALALMFMIYAVNYVDRQLLSILMEPIRKELHLSDTQLGFLSGLAFAIFYATLGIPIARLADRFSRRNILAISLALWSVMTAFSGLARSFPALLLARIGVGVGEAGGSPPAHSLISDYFAPTRRARALAVYSVGIPIGILLGLAGGGWINQAFGWRPAFFIVGFPGVVLALIFLFTVHEPARGAQDGGVVAQPLPGTGEAFRSLWRLKTFRFLTAAVAFHAFNGYGIQQWNPSYLIRTFGLGTREVGLHLGLIIGVAGGLGILTGGFVSDWAGKRDFRWYLWIPALSTAIAVPFYFATFLAHSASQALLFYTVPAFLGNLFTGPAFATVQALVPTRMRAFAASVFLFVINIVGLGMGPQAIGIMSDLMRHAFGVDSLRYALCVVNCAEIAALFCFLRAARTVVSETNAAIR